MLNIIKNIDGTTLTVRLSGDLDRLTAPYLEKSLSVDLPCITGLIIDLEGLEYISSAGLHSIMRFNGRIPCRGKINIININKEIKDILDLSGFIKCFPAA